MKSIHIVGHKNSGKTTLVTKLVAEFVARGLTVGTVKHTPHDHALDVPGKDSYRHRKAGAAAAALITPDGVALFHQQADEDKRWQMVEQQMCEFDLVVIEGHRQRPGPKIEVYDEACGRPPYCSEAHHDYLALVTDSAPADCNLRLFRRDDIAAVAELISEKILKG